MISMFRTGDIHIVSGFLYDNVEWELKKEEGYGGAKMYTLRHEVPQLRRSVYCGMPLGIPFEHFQVIPCHMGRGNFPFPQLGMEFNDNITSNN